MIPELEIINTPEWLINIVNQEELHQITQELKEIRQQKENDNNYHASRYLQNRLNELKRIRSRYLHVNIKDLLTNSCFYHSCGSDATPIVALKNCIHSFVYCDTCHDNFECFKSNVKMIKQRLLQQGFKKLHNFNIDMDTLDRKFSKWRREQLPEILKYHAAHNVNYEAQRWYINPPINIRWSIWEHNNQLYSLLYIQWDSICTWYALYLKNKITAKAVCEINYEGTPPESYEINGKMPEYYIGYGLSGKKGNIFNYENIGDVEYFGDYGNTLCSETGTWTIEKLISGISLDRHELVIGIGGSKLTHSELLKLHVTISPENAQDKTILWESSNKSVAKVNSAGVITITTVNSGTAIITAANNGNTVSCEVKVVNILHDDGVIINGVKWATRNVNKPGYFAEQPQDFGNRYQWNRKNEFNDSNPSGQTWEKINDPSPKGWRVPTAAELKTLLDTEKVASKWIKNNGVEGIEFTDKKTMKSVFFPADIGRYNRLCGYYWSSTPCGKTGFQAVHLYFDNHNSRYYPHSAIYTSMDRLSRRTPRFIGPVLE